MFSVTREKKHKHCSTHVLTFHKGQSFQNKNPIRKNKCAIRINCSTCQLEGGANLSKKSYTSIMVIVHLCLFNYCLLLSVSQVSLLFSFDGSALTLCSLLFLKDALSMMCFIPLQPSLFTLFSLSLLAKQEVGCQDCNLKDVRTITLNTRHHVTRRQFKKEKRDIKHQTAD